MDRTFVGIVMVIIIGGWIIGMAVLGEMIGKPKGRTMEGKWLGLLLGPLGLIITALLPDTRSAPTAKVAPPKLPTAKPAVSKLKSGRDDDDGTIPVYKL